MLIKEESDVLLRFDNREFLFVFVNGRLARVAARLRSKLREHVSKPWIRRQILVCAEMDADFGRIVAAENGTVVDKRNGKSKTRSRHCRADSGNTAAHHT